MNMGLVCIGLTTLDVVAHPIDSLPDTEGTTLIQGIEVVPAGTAAGAALVAATLGLKTTLIGAVGGDGAGRFVRMALDERGIDTALLATLPAHPTSTTVLAIDSNGRRPNFHAPGASFYTELSDEAFDAARKAKFVHWAGVGGPLLDGGAGAALLEAARASGATVICDLIAVGPGSMDEVERLLPHVDFFMPSAAEAFALTGATDLEKAADRFLELGAGTCILKDGAAGSYIASASERFRLPAHAVEVVDTTSCGDSYCAGFIAALDRGWTVRDACRFATATASLVAQGLGTLGRLESFEATERVMREYNSLEIAK